MIHCFLLFPFPMHIHRQGSDPDIQLTACGSITEESLPSKVSSDILFACSLIHKVKKNHTQDHSFLHFFPGPK
jgi:hypothetical protein